MMSFRAQIEDQGHYMTIFKVKGQIYHRGGSFLPFSGENHKFLQLCLISESNAELNARCGISPGAERQLFSSCNIFPTIIIIYCVCSKQQST